jgi:predicted enzyme related to lactoylglutathione lyase
MILREHYPSGVPSWVDIRQPDIEATVAFYGSLFGWRFEEQGPGGVYRIATLDGHHVAGVGAAHVVPSAPPAWVMYVAVDDASEAAARVQAASGHVLDGPAGVDGGSRRALCADPGGAVFGLWQSPGSTGAQVVNLANTWNFNELTTADRDGAEAFYGAVFGWQAFPIDFGIGAAAMFARPGYGDFLASIDPDVRRRHAEAGAPGDFTNAVAWLAEGDGPSRWDITFAVDDPDAVVEHAGKLGARVVEPVEDRGVVRMAILEDPQGAVFTVSHYQG